MNFKVIFVSYFLYDEKVNKLISLLRLTELTMIGCGIEVVSRDLTKCVTLEKVFEREI